MSDMLTTDVQGYTIVRPVTGRIKIQHILYTWLSKSSTREIFNTHTHMYLCHSRVIYISRQMFCANVHVIFATESFAKIKNTMGEKQKY